MTRAWYPHLVRLVNSTFPTLRRTHKRNLTLLTHAILKKRTLCQAELARAFPGRTKHHHKKKRLHRFAKNVALRPLALLARLIPTQDLSPLRLQPGKGPHLLGLDAAAG